MGPIKHYVKTDPTFFRLIKISFALAVVALLLLGILIPAPLLEPADPARVPNPVKSAWFLLWIQELVSYDKQLIYLIVAGGLFLLFLPWILRHHPSRAEWLPQDHRWFNVTVIIFTAAIIAMTIVAAFFRGENWSLAL